MQSPAGPMKGLEAELLKCLKHVQRDEVVKGSKGSWVQGDLCRHAKEVALPPKGRRILICLTRCPRDPLCLSLSLCMPEGAWVERGRLEAATPWRRLCPGPQG